MIICLQYAYFLHYYVGGQGKNKYCEYCIFTVPRIQLSFAIATMKIILNAEIQMDNIALNLKTKYP